MLSASPHRVAVLVKCLPPDTKDSLVKQTSEDPPESIGVSFAAEILKRDRQLILLLRKTVTSYIAACIVSYEKQTTLREASACLATELHPLDGPPAVIRVDPTPGFMALRKDETLKSLRLSLEIGRVKNPNKNPVVEKAILELEEELLKQEPTSGPVSQLGLVIAVARLNSCIHFSGLWARELWTTKSVHSWTTSHFRQGKPSPSTYVTYTKSHVEWKVKT